MISQQISYPTEAHSQTREIEDASYWYQHRNCIIKEAIKKYVSGHSEIYDLGGGNGVVSSSLQKEGYPCILVEALPDAIRIAKERNICETIQQSIEDFNQNDLPVILLLDVLEHIEKEEMILQKLFKQLKQNGILVITVPAFNHLFSNVDKEIGHYRRYTTKQLEKKLEQTGFTICYRTYFFSLLYFPLLFFRIIPDKLGLTNTGKKRRDKEHLANSHLLNKILLQILKFERIFIRHTLRIPMGTSCLFIATKK